MKRIVPLFPIYALDGLILALLLSILFILATGGGIYHIKADLLVRMYHITNPLIALYLLLLIRFLGAKSTPFLGIRTFDVPGLSGHAARFWDGLFDKLRALRPGKARQIVLMIIALSVFIKILNAYLNFGFFSGDDVEIQEMSFAHLYHWDWKAWNLRSPFFPLVFIYPVQFVLRWLGVQNPWALIFSGRLVVVSFSALNLWLVYKIATRLFLSRQAGLLSLVFLAMSKLHTAFASTELPRTVASSFILLSFWLLLSEKHRYRRAVLSGVMLGIGAALRFSELIFVVPAVLFLIFRRRWRLALVLGLMSAAAFLIIVGVSDALYWKTPLYSLKNVVDYTLVKKLSSRGYESPLFYALSIGTWSNFLTAGLLFFALRLKNQKVYLWAFSPLVMLSFLPHKEPRYLVPSIPFIAMMAGLSAWHLLEKLRNRTLKMAVPRKLASLHLAPFFVTFGAVLLSSKDYRFAYIAIPLLFFLALLHRWLKRKAPARSGAGDFRDLSARLGLVLFFAVVFMGALEIDGFRLRRSESGVEMARFLAGSANIKAAAIEESWKAGGRLYLWKLEKILDIEGTDLLNVSQLFQEIQKNGIQAVGLRDEHIGSLKDNDYLASLGFKEVVFSKKRRLDQYRLFIR